MERHCSQWIHRSGWGAIWGVFAVAVVAWLTSGSALATDDCSGDGAPTWSSEDDAYLISNEGELTFIGTNEQCLDDSFLMVDDISISIAPWVPISHFSGTFNGGGHSITGLVLDGQNAGLFNTDDGALISDLVIDDVSVDHLNASVDENIGALIGFARGASSIENVHVLGTLIGTNSVGGLIGFASSGSSITSSSFEGDVSVSGSVGFSSPGVAGGLIGTSIGDFSVRDSSYAGGLEGGESVGGLAGSVVLGSTTVVDSSVSGSVTSNDELGDFVNGCSGGLIGRSGFEVSVFESSFDGTVEATMYAGGLVACVAKGEVLIAGSDVTGSVIANLGDRASTRTVAGGLVALAELGVSISNSSFDGDVEAGSRAGGLVGHVSGGPTEIEGSFASGTVVASAGGEAGGSYAGGIVGLSHGSVKVRLSYFSGDSSASSAVGGVIGYGRDDIRIASSFAAGSVTSITAVGVGGLVGRAKSNVDVSMSFYNGSVSGSADVGGLVGIALGDRLTLGQTYFVGLIEDLKSPLESDLAGRSTGEQSISASFCTSDSCTDGMLVTEDDLVSSSFLRDFGWKMGSDWCSSSGVNDNFPVVRAITFGPLDWGCAIRRVVFDPDGGTCIVDGETIDHPWMVKSRNRIRLPSDGSCSRDGFALLGWTEDSAIIETPTLIETHRVLPGDYRAVWSQLPGAPTSLQVVRDFLCGQCGSALVLWTAPDDDVDVIGTEVSIDGAPVECEFGETEDVQFCVVEIVAPGPSDFQVRLQGEEDFGPPLSVVG